MSWGAVVADEARRLGNPTYLPAHGWDQYRAARAGGRRPLTSMGRAQADAFTAGVEWVTRTQQEWDTLPTVDAIWELRRGEDSIFYPLFKADPRIWVSCPTDTVHIPGARVVTDRNGICSDCGYDLVHGTRILEGDN